MINPKIGGIATPSVRVILDPTQRPVVPSADALRRATDVRTALCRGLAEYLGQIQGDAEDGRLVKIAKVYDTWPSQENIAQYPAILVTLDGPGVYDASRMTPDVLQAEGLPPGMSISAPTEFVASVKVVVKCQDNRQRAEVFALIEAALTPVDWMYGVRLELPFYFDQRSEYRMESSEYLDDPETAQQNVRDGFFKVAGVIPLIRVIQRPVAQKPRLRLSVDGKS